MRVSTLLLTRNEEANLPRCLAALDWCDDVVVVDSLSEDRTVEIAESAGARVIQRPFDSFAEQRNHGLDHGGLRHEWVLHLDADEAVTPELREEMVVRLPDASEDAFRVASRTMFQGRWLRHAGMYPAYQVRIGRRDVLRFEQVGHGQREREGLRIGTMRSDIEHHTFSKGLEDWIARHNRYSTAEAKHEAGAAGQALARLDGALAGDPTARRRWLKRTAARLPLRPTLRFLYMYVLRLGFLDGAPGYTYCRLLAMYERMITLKVDEIERERAGRPG